MSHSTSDDTITVLIDDVDCLISLQGTNAGDLLDGPPTKRSTVPTTLERVTDVLKFFKKKFTLDTVLGQKTGEKF